MDLLPEPNWGADDLDRMHEQLAQAFPGQREISPHQVNLNVFGGVNRASFSFHDASGVARYPPLPTYVAMQRYRDSGQGSPMAWLITDTYWNADGYDIRRGEYLFHGPDGNHEKPVWTFALQFMLPFSLALIAREIRFRRIERWNTVPDSDPTPTVRLSEAYMTAGGVQTRSFVNRTLTQSEMEGFTASIVAS